MRSGAGGRTPVGEVRGDGRRGGREAGRLDPDVAAFRHGGFSDDAQSTSGGDCVDRAVTLVRGNELASVGAKAWWCDGEPAFERDRNGRDGGHGAPTIDGEESGLALPYRSSDEEAMAEVAEGVEGDAPKRRDTFHLGELRHVALGVDARDTGG